MSELSVVTVAVAPAADRAVRPAPELTAVVPVFNRRADIAIVVGRLSRVLASCDWEVIFVDDNSADGSAAAAREIGFGDSRVRCIRRIGRRGAADAGLEGILASQARYVAVMGGTPQPDETMLVAMLDRLRGGRIDVATASRQRSNGGRWSRALMRRLLGLELADPMSDYFMVRREAAEALAPALSLQGTSLLLELLLSAPGMLRVTELPLSGRNVDAPKTAVLDAVLALEFAGHIVGRLSRGAISIRFLKFCLVGLTGVGVHMAILGICVLDAGLAFAVAQTAAAIVAMMWNFTLNNVFTYRDQRLTGRAFVTGLIRFQLACAIGALSNIGAAGIIYSGGQTWWVAGLGGVLIGAVWNYAVTSVFVWRKS